MRINEQNDIEKNITLNLNKYMSEKNKKRADLALYLETTTASVSRFFTGISTPSIIQIVKICEFLDITIYQLLGIEDPTILTDDEIKIIKACRDDSNNLEYVKRVLNIK